MYNNPNPAQLAELAALAKATQPDTPAPSCLLIFYDPTSRGRRSLAMVPPDETMQTTTQTTTQTTAQTNQPELDYLHHLFKERRALEERIFQQIEHLLAHMPPHNASAVSTP
jgi:hypothetical protein